ncbi:MAG: glycine cleavage system protein GcvH [Magnetococcus sp. DMHC-6]
MANLSELPAELKYTKEHEWARMAHDGALVGITRFAADQLGDVVFVELPEVGASLTAGQPFGVVESVKSVSDLFSPFTGTVMATNDDLRDAPELVNEDPYGRGWMLKIKRDANKENEEDLLSAEEYHTLIQEH